MFSSASLMMINIIFLWFVCASASATTLMSHGKNMTIRCNRKDGHMLSIWKQGIKDPSNRLSSWSTIEDCCNWTGVQCDNITGRVTELHLTCPDSNLFHNFPDTDRSKCLGGAINFSHLLELEFLSFLNLSGNDFEAIHFEWGSHKLPNKAPSSSPINFSNLRFLDLSLNYNLQMDNLRWVTHFSSSLKYLNLGGIDLHNETLWLQWMAMLPSLKELRMRGCHLNGINPSLGYVNLTSLAILDISDNNFDSEIPKWLFNLSNRISFLDLSFNGLRGEIPTTMLSFQHLKSLILNNNSLNGSIPKWIGKFKHLEELDLDSNLLSGPIPDTIGNLSSLTLLSVRHNNLNGSFPIALGHLSKLKTLWIGYNSLSGNLSEKSFTKLSSLKSLELDSSALIFDFSTHWRPPFQLKEISMRNCTLGPRFPSWLYTQRSLNYLDLSSSGLSFNALQDEFLNFVTQIRHLDLSNNSISGDISTTLITSKFFDLSSNYFTGKLPRLSPKVTFFNIANNNFSGPISPLLCQNMPRKQELLAIDMSHNHLFGELPDCWMHWQSLLHVNLESNNLSGEIPDSMGSLVKLEALRLRNNFLSGSIPSSLRSCRKLWLLDLAFNELTGNIPTWIMPLTMMALLLRSNKFNGRIPSQTCQLSNLLVLDLANNTLSGQIPKCLSNLTTMGSNTLDEHLFDKYYNRLGLKIPFSKIDYRWGLMIPFSESHYQENLYLFVKGHCLDYWKTLEFVRFVDLSSNELSGPIPPELFTLVAVQSLNLSHNHLMGKMPSEIGQMEFLEALDLSGNLLSGEIPESISNLSFLNNLNLSFNNFYGRIPLGIQLQSFGASSYIGNAGLCGPPLSNCTQEEKPTGLVKSVELKDGDFLSSFKTGLAVGFASAFWGFFCALLFVRTWRHAYFHFLEYLFRIVVVKIKNLFGYEGH